MVFVVLMATVVLLVPKGLGGEPFITMKETRAIRITAPMTI